MVSDMLHGAGIFSCRTVEGLDIVIPSIWIVMITFHAHMLHGAGIFTYKSWSRGGGAGGGSGLAWISHG